MSDDADKPFSIDYVVKTTTKHMLKSIDMSIKKTVDRIPEFAGNIEKSKEILVTLSTLHRMKLDVEQYRDAITADSSGEQNDN